MAVTLGKSPVVMTAVNDEITGPWKITTIRFITTDTSGSFILTDNGGTHEEFRTRTLQTNDSEESAPWNWLDGLKVSQIPANAKVYVYYE